MRTPPSNENARNFANGLCDLISLQEENELKPVSAVLDTGAHLLGHNELSAQQDIHFTGSFVMKR
jgi:hypothetical protein